MLSVTDMETSIVKTKVTDTDGLSFLSSQIMPDTKMSLKVAPEHNVSYHDRDVFIFGELYITKHNT